MTSAPIDAWEALFRAQVRVLRVLHAEFPEDVISFNEYDVLFNISREVGHEIRMRDLTRNVLLSQSSVSRMVDRLAARGLVEKRSDPTDGRGAIVALTEQGYQVYTAVAREHGRAIESHMERALSAVELRQLRELSLKLQAAMPDIAPHVQR